MESVPAHTLRCVPPGDRQHLGYARQVMVKSGVETRYLGQVRKSAMKRLGQQDLLRQIVRIEGTEAV